MSIYRSQAFIVVVLTSILCVSAEARFQVNQYTRHEQTWPAVAMNARGDFVVVWRSHVDDGRGGGVFARRYLADGSPASDEFKVNVTDVNLDSWTPAVAMNSSGGFIVVWPADRDGDSDIVARMFDSQGIATTEELPISSAPDAAQSSPAISMNSSGSFVVVWAGLYGDAVHGRSYVSGRVFSANGNPKTDEFRVNGLAQECWPDVAMDDSGRFVVSWIRMGDTYNRPYGEYMMCRRFDANARPVDEAVFLTGDLNSRWYGPGVAADRQGGFVVTWAVGPFPYDVVAQGFDSNDAPTTQPHKVNTSVEGNQGHPAIAGNRAGDFLIVWDNQGADGICSGVSARLCTLAGQFKCQEIVLCSPEPQRQWYPKVAMADDGGYVVVWIGQASDGTYDVFAQIGSP
jgi:hypothetical protein